MAGMSELPGLPRMSVGQPGDPPKRTIQPSQASVASVTKGATMDDQRDYAEERANLLLMHEECEGCETCQPSADLPKWDEAGYNYLLHFELPN
jgi:hypothetical protein